MDVEYVNLDDHLMRRNAEEIHKYEDFIKLKLKFFSSDDVIILPYMVKLLSILQD